MMSLDRRTGTLKADALDHVRIKRPLQQPLNFLRLSRLVLRLLFNLFLTEL